MHLTFMNWINVMLNWVTLENTLLTSVLVWAYPGCKPRLDGALLRGTMSSGFLTSICAIQYILLSCLTVVCESRSWNTIAALGQYMSFWYLSHTILQTNQAGQLSEFCSESSPTYKLCVYEQWKPWRVCASAQAYMSLRYSTMRWVSLQTLVRCDIWWYLTIVGTLWKCPVWCSLCFLISA